MRAQVITQFGDPDVFTPLELPRPAVIPGHVLIHVAATSVNPLDYLIRGGKAPALAPALPAVLHGDVAGTIAEIGAGVAHLAPGDEVYACAGGIIGSGGALAEYMLADAALVAPKPRTLTMAAAAALPLVSITAWEGLIQRARVQADQTVLVQGATGGVGHIGVQVAKWAGATVIATVISDAQAAVARALGADQVVNVRTSDLADAVAAWTGGAGCDIVFDTRGGDILAQSFALTALNGTVVAVDSRARYDLHPLHAKGLTLHVVYMLLPLLTGQGRAAHGRILIDLAALVEAGHVRPLLDANQFTFDAVAAAHRRAQSGEQIGKVVLTR